MELFGDEDEAEEHICEVCGDVSAELTSCDLCDKSCCSSCLRSSGLCAACQEIPEY
jgi:hypothetical protein